jgi:hypothetical protein
MEPPNAATGDSVTLMCRAKVYRGAGDAPAASHMIFLSVQRGAMHDNYDPFCKRVAIIEPAPFHNMFISDPEGTTRLPRGCARLRTAARGTPHLV